MTQSLLPGSVLTAASAPGNSVTDSGDHTPEDTNA